jgi:disulfide oxidoreductase YuzD
MNAKEILNENIKLCQILMRILARFKDGKDFKSQYMNIVEDYEKEEEIMMNRIKLRKYLRELVVNQKRVLEAALNEEYI